MYTKIRKIVLLLSLSIVISNILCSAVDTNNFGPFNVNYTKFDLCMGPKSKNLTRYMIFLTSEGLTFYANYNVTFLAPTQIDQVKIVVYSIKNKKINSLLWTYKINDPCKHYALSAVFNAYWKTSDCIVKKGTYIGTLNLEQIQNNFYGKSFFYGEFLVKTTIISKKGNIICATFGMWFTKKSKTAS